jgi:hypothetical protein
MLVDVARRVSDFLTKHRVPHAVAGGLAVRAHGYDRDTADADFFVEEVPKGPLREFAPSARWYLRPGTLEGAGFSMDSVRVELFVRHLSRNLRAVVKDDLTSPTVIDGVPVLAPVALVAAKMCAGRDKDTLDIVELLKRGVVPVDEITERFTALLPSSRPWLKTLMWRVALLESGRWRGCWRDRWLTCSVYQQGTFKKGRGANRWGVPISEVTSLRFSCGHFLSESWQGTPL